MPVNPLENGRKKENMKEKADPENPARHGKGRKRERENRLNELCGKDWLKFQKSWFVLNPRPRGEDVLLHPAKFPEELVEGFIKFFTKKGQVVFDPMAGTGSTLVAALQCRRSAVGIELQEKYASIALERCSSVLGQARRAGAGGIFAKVHCGDALGMDSFRIPKVDYCITSPPYWDMLRARGFETQKKRKGLGLDVHYSDDPRDAGNIGDYEAFVEFVCGIYGKVHGRLKDGGYLTVIVKNVKKKGRIYPLAWDIAGRLGGLYALKDEKIWCQDNQRLAPYGYGYAWVSNTMHHYCLNFRKEPK